MTAQPERLGFSCPATEDEFPLVCRPSVLLVDSVNLTMEVSCLKVETLFGLMFLTCFKEAVSNGATQAL